MTDSFTTIRNLLFYEFSGTFKQQEIEAHLDVLEAELKRYREREPLVQALVEAWNLWTGQEMYGELIREGMVPSDFEAWESTVDAVRDFCISGASTDVASEANAAGSSGSEPTK
jgi:hypothetical protein